MRIFLQSLKGAAHEWKKDQAPELAAALSYYMVFSLAPLLLIIISGLSLFLESEEVQVRILSFFTENIGPQSTQIIQSMINARPQEMNFTLTNLIGVTILMVTATTALTHLQKAFNTIWEVKIKPKAGLKVTFFKRLISLGLILVIGFFISVSFLLSTAISLGLDWIKAFFPAITYIFPLSEAVLSVGLMSLLFTLMFQYLPDVKLKFRQVWLGGLLTGILFYLGKTLISWYFSSGGGLSAYGAGGSLIAILLWVYYSSMILFYGMEFTQVWMEKQGIQVKPQLMAVHTSQNRSIQLPQPPSVVYKIFTAFKVIRKEVQLFRWMKRKKKWFNKRGGKSKK